MIILWQSSDDWIPNILFFTCNILMPQKSSLTKIWFPYDLKRSATVCDHGRQPSAIDESDTTEVFQYYLLKIADQLIT